jgi:polysaccharide pyruvyl transferase WcaK-like protein
MTLLVTRCISISDINMIINIGMKRNIQNTAAREQKNILLLGNYGNLNIGDEMLLRAVVRDTCRDTNKKVIINVPTRNPDFVDIYHKADSHLIRAIPINTPSKVLHAFFQSDLIIVGGGGIWSGYTGPLAHLIPIVTIAGKMFGKKVDFRAVGVYLTASKLDRFFVNLAIFLADSCSVRDKESYQLLWKPNQKNARQVNDLAVSYLRTFSSVDMDKETLPKEFLAMPKNKIIIGISVKPVKTVDTNNKIIGEFSDAIRSLNSKYPGRLHFIFFPFAKTHSKVESDEEFAKSIIADLSNTDNITVFQHTDPLTWFMAIREHVHLFMGMRLHSIIFASEASKPLLCIPYEHKITEYLKEKRSGAATLTISLENLRSSEIVDFVEQQMKNMPTGIQRHETSAT